VEKRMSPAEIERNEIRDAIKEVEEKKKQESDFKLMKKFEQLNIEELKELYNEREKIAEEREKIEQKKIEIIKKEEEMLKKKVELSLMEKKLLRKEKELEKKKTLADE
ncbi:MAG: hypothetical protein KJ886_00185, partial [Candidatus Thermoplasmatota archaeon]|nr:hypothetical protein [Candidatus Thermoplasmatota archaeon]